MTAQGAVSPDPAHDARLALSLFLAAPGQLGGLSLRGSGPAREALIEMLRDTGVAVRRMPAHVDDERLLGGVDLAASLAGGRTVRALGLLEEIAGGVLVVPLAERVDHAIAGRLAQALDGDARFGLVLLDDGTQDEAPPAALLERVAFHCDLTHARRVEGALRSADPATVAPLDEEALHALAATAAALGVDSVRALNFAALAARANAALAGRGRAHAEDIATAARLVLGPRATRLPEMPDQAEEEEPAPPPDPSDAGERDEASDLGQTPLEDLVLDATLASIPPDLLAQLAEGRARRSSGSGGGKKHISGLRGKPLSARPGSPRGGARLALVDTLRAAVPWQQLRRREYEADNDRLIIRSSDIRVRRYEERSGRVTIFCVDASGSAAAARLAEAKGAVELMLAQAYVTRSEVALVAFRGTGAELLLPPTRSLTRARRVLSGMPGGGGTPLALGLNAGHQLAEAVEARGKTAHLVVLTDGRGNIDGQGKGGRPQAKADALDAARAIAAHGIDALVVDISARTAPEADELAQAMHARFLALPMADAAKLHAAVKAAAPQARAA